MTSVVASAPGKLILFGEYAVLRGGPAIVLAVGRRARVQVSHGVESNLLSAPEIIDRTVPFEKDATGKVSWPGVDASTAARLALLGVIIETCGPRAPVHIETDTSAFHEHGIKLGFGSSAALTVAASAALSGERPPLQTLIQTHRAAQNGRGSGVDIAASLQGGVLMFRSQPLQATPRSLPAGLQMCCVWTGRAASTPEFLRRLGGLDERHAALDVLVDSAEAQVAGLDGTAASWVTAVRNFSVDLQHFARQSSLPIYAGGHAEVAELATRHGVVYKPSGAGGGDLGIAVSEDVAAISAFTEGLRAGPAQVLRLDPDPHGLNLN